VSASEFVSASAKVDGKHQAAVRRKWVENDNDAEMGTNVGEVEGQFVFSYFVRWVYLFRYPTARSRPHKLTSQILALSGM
jgi:hypothetical protein